MSGLGDTYKTTGAVKNSESEGREHQADILAKRVVTIPLNMQERFDYTGRSDGQPLYVGYGAKGLGVGDEGWLIFKYTYDGSAFMTVKQIAYGTWTGRAALTYE